MPESIISEVQKDLLEDFTTQSHTEKVIDDGNGKGWIIGGEPLIVYEEMQGNYIKLGNWERGKKPIIKLSYTDAMVSRLEEAGIIDKRSESQG